jgi:glutaredoxin-related protein
MSSSVLMIDVPQLLVGVAITSLVSMSTLYGYTQYCAYARQEKIRQMYSSFWDIFNATTQLTALGTLWEGVDVLKELSEKNTLESGNLKETVVNILADPRVRQSLHVLMSEVVGKQN